MKYYDETVEFIGGNWTGVMSECLKHNVFPCLLFYEREALDDIDEEELQQSRDFYEYE